MSPEFKELQELVKNLKTIRLMLGHGFTDNDLTYQLQTLKDNVQLFTPDHLPNELMSTVVLAHGGLWQGGDQGALATLCSNTVSQSNGTIACASIDYRLSGDLGGVCTGTVTDTYTDQLRDMALAY